MTINISGQVPDKDHNGMYDLEEEWARVADPDPIYAVVLVRDGLTLKKDGTRKPVMRFTAIVPLTDGRAATARGWLEEYVANHQGTPLDMPKVEEPKLDLEQPLADKDAEWEAAAPKGDAKVTQIKKGGE